MVSEGRRIQSDRVCWWRHRNQYVVVIVKLHRIQCATDRMSYAVFKAGCCAKPYPVRDSQNEGRRIQSDLVCRWRHRNQYVVVMQKLHHIQCAKGRMGYAVFKAGDIELKPAGRSW
jgi:Zn-finger protein